MGDAVHQLSSIEIAAYVLTYMGGVLMNYIVKTKREHMDWKAYWTLNPVTSVAAILVSTGMCISLILNGETNHLTYFSLAFMAENLINTQTTKNEQQKEDSQG